jgi:hypothetical protein
MILSNASCEKLGRPLKIVHMFNNCSVQVVTYNEDSERLISYMKGRLIFGKIRNVKSKKGKVAVHAMRACSGSRDIAPVILNLGDRWM